VTEVLCQASKSIARFARFNHGLFSTVRLWIVCASGCISTNGRSNYAAITKETFYLFSKTPIEDKFLIGSLMFLAGYIVPVIGWLGMFVAFGYSLSILRGWRAVKRRHCQNGIGMKCFP